MLFWALNLVQIYQDWGTIFQQRATYDFSTIGVNSVAGDERLESAIGAMAKVIIKI